MHFSISHFTWNGYPCLPSTHSKMQNVLSTAMYFVIQGLWCDVFLPRAALIWHLCNTMLCSVFFGHNELFVKQEEKSYIVLPSQPTRTLQKSTNTTGVLYMCQHRYHTCRCCKCHEQARKAWQAKSIGKSIILNVQLARKQAELAAES